MVAANQLISEVTVKDAASAVADRVAAAMDRLAASEAQVQDRAVTSTRALEQSARQMERYRAVLDPVYRERQRLAEIEARGANAVSLGTAKQEEVNRILERQRAVVERAAAAQLDQVLVMERARQAAENAQSAFNQVLGVQAQLGNSARDSAAAFQPLLEQMEREAELLRVIETERASQAAANAQGRFNQILGVDRGRGAGSAAASAAVFQAADEEADALRRAQLAARDLVEQHDLLAGATRRYDETVAQANAHLAANRITAEQHQVILTAQSAALDRARAAADQVTNAWRLQGWQARQLSLQINDVVTSLALGANPMTVLLQQGGQIAQIFPISGRALLGFGGIVGGVALVLGTAAAAFIKGSNESAAFTRAVQLTGNAAGVTAGRLDDLVGRAAAASIIGASAARSIATEMVASGKIGEQVIGRLLAITEDYAVATDQSTAEAGSALTKLFADPLKGAQQLDDAYNLLTDAQRQYIRTLVEQGQRTQAQIELTDALNERTRNLAQDGLGWLERAWNSVAGAASDAWDAMKGIGRPDTLEEQIEEARRAVARGPNIGIASLATGNAQANLDRLLAMKAAQDAQAAADARDSALRAETKVLGDVSRGYDSLVSKQLELENQAIRFQNTIQGIRDKMADFRDDGGAQGPLGELLRDLKLLEQGASDTALALGALRTPLEESRAQTGIAASLSAMSPAQRGPREAYLTTLDRAAHGSPEEARQAEALAADAFTRALIEQNRAINDNNALSAITAATTREIGAAYLDSAAAVLRAQAAQKAAQQAFQTGADAEAQTRIILNDLVAKGYEDGAKQLAQLRLEAAQRERIAEAAGLGAAAQSAVELQIRIEEATKALLAMAEVADGDLAARLRAIADGIGDAMARGDEADRLRSIREAIRGQERSLQLVAEERRLVGATNDEHDIAIALLRAKLDLQDRNVDAASAEGQAYLRNAEILARQENALRQQRREREAIDGFLDDSIDKGAEFAPLLADGTKNLKDLGDTGREVLNELIRLFIELAYVNPFKNKLELGGDAGRPTLQTALDAFSNSSGGQSAGGGGGMPGGGTSPGVGNPAGGGISSGGGFPFNIFGSSGGASGPTVNASGFRSTGAGPGASANTAGIGGPAAYGSGSWMGAGIGATIGGTAGYFLGDAIGGKTGGKIGAILGALLGAFIGYGFESGGVMTSRGPLPLRRYRDYGVADSPQVAIWAEGQQPEAFVPLPDGRAIDVNLRMPRGAMAQPANDHGGAGGSGTGGGTTIVNQTINFPRPTNGFKRSRQQEFGMASEALMRTLRSVG